LATSGPRTTGSQRTTAVTRGPVSSQLTGHIRPDSAGRRKRPAVAGRGGPQRRRRPRRTDRRPCRSVLAQVVVVLPACRGRQAGGQGSPSSSRACASRQGRLAPEVESASFGLWDSPGGVVMTPSARRPPGLHCLLYLVADRVAVPQTYRPGSSLVASLSTNTREHWPARVARWGSARAS
jgi:hypothetical protein